MFRDLNSLFFNSWILKFEFTKDAFIQLSPSIITNIFIYNVPDMLWFISGILLIRFIWFNVTKEQRVYLLCFYLIGFVFEIWQLSDNFPGTFDCLDLLFMGIGAFFESLLNNKLIRRSSQ